MGVERDKENTGTVSLDTRAVSQPRWTVKSRRLRLFAVRHDAERVTFVAVPRTLSPLTTIFQDQPFGLATHLVKPNNMCELGATWDSPPRACRRQGFSFQQPHKNHQIVSLTCTTASRQDLELDCVPQDKNTAI